jgi:hypothetical protein
MLNSEDPRYNMQPSATTVLGAEELHTAVYMLVCKVFVGCDTTAPES